MKVLITGGAGYVGTALVKALCESPEITNVCVYDNLSRGNYNICLGDKIPNGHKIEFINGDILDSRLLKKHIADKQVVYHLAAKVTTPFANTDPHFYEQVNHWGTAEVVYAVEESDVEKFVYLSSTSVYGSSNSVVTEDSALNPRTFYGISKMRGEEHVARLMDSRDTLIMRCGNVFGYSRSMRFDAVINKFVFDANFHNRVTINGNGKQSRSFIHVNTLKDTLKQLAVSKVPSGTYNLICQNHNVLDLLDVMKDIKPNLEFIFVNQHLSLRNLVVEADLKLRSHILMTGCRSLKEELTDFMDKFAF